MTTNPNWPKPGETWKTRNGYTFLVSQLKNGMLAINNVPIAPNGNWYATHTEEHPYDLIDKVEPLPAPVTRYLVEELDGEYHSTMPTVKAALSVAKNHARQVYEVEIHYKKRVV